MGPVSYTHLVSRINKVLGIEISREQMVSYFESLEMKVSGEGDDLYVTPPTVRQDIEMEEDLIEEVARLYGYDKLHVTIPKGCLLYTSFPDARKYFKEPEKNIDAGNPVRKNFFSISKRQAREKLGIPQDDFVVFTFGGSLGSVKINEVACELIGLFNGHEGVSMISGTGRWYYQEVVDKLSQDGIRLSENVRVKDYIENMDLHLLACDVVISRAGALSVAETTVCGKAAILIPSPNVTGNHQYYNAKAVADRGGAILILSLIHI